jgi:glycosyltransferase involved in cell wall biosynthesis
MLAPAKEFFKRSAFLRQVNAAVKNAVLERRTRRVAADYQQRLSSTAVDASPEAVRNMIAARMAAAGVANLERLSRQPNIFLVGTEYEQERAGFIQGIAKWGQVVALKRADGHYGLKPSIGTYDRATIAENSRQVVEQVEAASAERPIDVLIGTMVAQYVSVEALQHLRSRGIPVVNIAMDDRLIDHWGTFDGIRLGAMGLTPGADLVLQTTAEYVPRYLLEGCPAVYWPFGSDPDLFRPWPTKRYDVCFVGNNYGWRSELMGKLSAAGIAVECFGRGFPNGHIGAEDVARVLGESRIVLGVGTIAHSRHIVTLKLRDFDAPMSGSLYVTTDNPDLQPLFRVGEEIVTYRSVEDCIRLLRHYLEHDDERAAIAAAGRRRAMTDHTWERRIGDALALLGLPSRPRGDA